MTMTIYKMDAENNKAPWTLFPSKVKFYDHRFYETEYDVRKTYALLEQIPENARVSSSNNFTPHLAQRKSIYFFPKVKDAEYIVFSLDDNNYLISEAENIKERNKYLLSPEWDIVERAYPVFLLKRRITPSPVKKDLNVIWSRVDTLKCNFENFDDTLNHILYSNMTKADTISHLSDKVVKSGRHSVSLTPEDPYTHAITLDKVKDTESIEFSAWHYGDSEKVFMVLDNKNGYYKSSNTVVESNADGWHKIKLNCRLIEAKNKLGTIIYVIELSDNNFMKVSLCGACTMAMHIKTIIYVWNSGDQIEYIDDMELIIRYK